MDMAKSLDDPECQERASGVGNALCDDVGDGAVLAAGDSTRQAPTKTAMISTAGRIAHAISAARRGVGTSGEPVTDGTARTTARMMKYCDTTQAIAATTNSVVGTAPGHAVPDSIEVGADVGAERD